MVSIQIWLLVRIYFLIYENNMKLDDSRPYSGSAGKYLVWANEVC